MSWKDNFTSKGSFRGAEFYVESDRLDAGRRVQTHEFPLRDTPYNEDLGRMARKMSFQAFCLGLNYHDMRDKLITEIEKPGPGTLKHPYYGTLSVVVVRFSVRNSTKHGGMASVTLEFVEAGEHIFPTSRLNTRLKVKSAADKGIASAVADFADVFDLSDASTASSDFLAEVSSVFSPVTSLLGDVTTPLSGLLQTPSTLGSSLASLVTGIVDLVDAPLDAVAVFRKLFNAGSTPSFSNNSPRAQQTARNKQALHELVRRTSVLSAARSSSDLELSPAKQSSVPLTRQKVTALRDELLDEIDSLQESTDVVSGEPIDDDVYQDLASARLAVVQDLSSRAGRLPSVQAYTPRATLPAVVLAHRLYGDASRETEIVALNRVAHPGFVAGGHALEVLSE